MNKKKKTNEMYVVPGKKTIEISVMCGAEKITLQWGYK